MTGLFSPGCASLPNLDFDSRQLARWSLNFAGQRARCLRHQRRAAKARASHRRLKALHLNVQLRIVCAACAPSASCLSPSACQYIDRGHRRTDHGWPRMLRLLTQAPLWNGRGQRTGQRSPQAELLTVQTCPGAARKWPVNRPLASCLNRVPDAAWLERLPPAQAHPR